MNIVIADDDFYYVETLEKDVKKHFSTIDRKLNVFTINENFDSILTFKDKKEWHFFRKTDKRYLSKYYSCFYILE